MTTPIKHTLATRIFHHLSLVLLVVIWALAEFRDSIGNAMDLHKAFGVLFLGWVVLRLINAGVRKRLPKPSVRPPIWQTALAHLTHTALYLTMLAMPIVGILMSAYGGRAVSVFGIVSVPAFVKPSREMASFFNGLHTDILFPLLMVLIGLHIAGALYHQFILKDGLLNRMR